MKLWQLGQCWQELNQLEIWSHLLEQQLVLVLEGQLEKLGPVVELVLEQLRFAVDGQVEGLVGTGYLNLNWFYVAELAGGPQLLLYPWLFLLGFCTLDYG